MCSSFQTTIRVNFAIATLRHIVENFAQGHLNYGEDGEFVVNNEVGILYDIDETDNLDKKLTELGKDTLSFINYSLVFSLLTM